MGSVASGSVDIIRDGEILSKNIISKRSHKKNKGNYIFSLPEEYKSLYSDWKIIVERITLLRCDKMDLLYIRNCLSNIDYAFANGNDNESYIENLIREIVDFHKNRKNQIKQSKKKVFIVHGHDELYLSLTESFIRKLGLEPIILRDQVSQSQTIVEKLENNTDVAFAIVLYTGCDRGSINDSKAPLNPRARQNVIYEHGFLNAKLGRKKVCALVQEGVEVPSDLAGVVYTKIDKDGAWKIALAKEMQAAGLNFELNHLIE